MYNPYTLIDAQTAISIPSLESDLIYPKAHGHQLPSFCHSIDCHRPETVYRRAGKQNHFLRQKNKLLRSQLGKLVPLTEAERRTLVRCEPSLGGLLNYYYAEKSAARCG